MRLGWRGGMKKLSRSCSSWVGEAGSELDWGGGTAESGLWKSGWRQDDRVGHG